jgi:hypothetical protein
MQRNNREVGKMKTWQKDENKGGALKISKEDFLALGLPESAIEKGEQRGELKTFGPWGIPVSYKALAMSVKYTPEDKQRYTAENDGATAYGIRTLTNVRQGGYELEGRVSVNGKKYRGFTSSQLFEIDGKLVDVATIYVCMN